MQYNYATAWPNPPYIVRRLIEVWPSAPSANFLLWPQLTQNAFLEVVILASGTGKSHTGPYQASTVLGRWHSLSFWPKTLVQRWLCAIKIELFRNQSCGDAFHAQNISHNVMNGLKRYVHLLSQLSKTHTTIFEHQFLDFVDVFVVRRRWRSTRTRQINYHFSALFECFIPFICLCFWHARFTVGLLQHFQWFGTRNFVWHTKFKANSLFN